MLPREKRFRRLTLAGTLLGLVTISDSFLYLLLQRKLDMGVTAFPLLYVGTSLATALLAFPCGRAADLFGRSRVLLAGYGALAIVYVLVLLIPDQTSPMILLPVLGALGLHYAATDGVLAALGAGLVPKDHAGSGLSLLATAANLGRLAASIGFGWLWGGWGASFATLLYLAFLLAALAGSAFLLRGISAKIARNADTQP
jgi:MFS family permease